ncbi:SiaB family protein kinase [Desulfococcaceae bacterium HSG8]|nr:SiaB family protein kinase [Desulfococcaceae bacterium HSG8]
MVVDKLYSFKKDLSRQGVFFCFSGPVSQDLLVEFGTILKQKIKLEMPRNAVALRVFSMVVEQAQNIIHYSAEKCPKDNKAGKEEELSIGIIAVGYESGHYFVLSGNVIEHQNVERLRKRLIKLRKMSKEELKKHYKEQRRKGPDIISKGAGLGFIDMAKKASRPIEFDFKTIDENYSFFSSKTVI